jgi:two-component system response regulator FixJ
MSLQEIYVFVVDDDPAVGSALQRALESAGMSVNAFTCANDCLAALSRQPCDVVITDVRMEDMDGLSLLRDLRQRFPWLQVIVATAYGTVPLAVTAMKAGATDFLEKPLDRQELLAAVRSAMDTVLRSVSFPRDALSYAEVQVLRLFLEGRTSKETATALNRSTRTVEAHRHNIMRKFGVHNAVQLAQKASALWSGEFRFEHVPGCQKNRVRPQPPHTKVQEGP